MKRLAQYLRALAAEANFGAAPRSSATSSNARSFARTLDHPTYLRRRLTIAGVTDQLHLRN